MRPAAPTGTDPAGVDPRGQRVAAAITAVVLAVVLVTASTWLLALQTVVFAIAVWFGVRRSPYALAYARLLRPRLGPPAALEDPRPPRFAQGVGLAFAAVGLVGYLAGATVARRRGHRSRPGRRPAQCRLRPVPGLRDVPSAGACAAAGSPNRAPSDPPTKESP